MLHTMQAGWLKPILKVGYCYERFFCSHGVLASVTEHLEGCVDVGCCTHSTEDFLSPRAISPLQGGTTEIFFLLSVASQLSFSFDPFMSVFLKFFLRFLLKQIGLLCMA